MSEGFDAADEQNRNLIAVSCEQVGVPLDVDLVQCVQFGAAGPENLFFHFVTELTARFGVKNHLCFFGQLFSPSQFFSVPPQAQSACQRRRERCIKVSCRAIL